MDETGVIADSLNLMSITTTKDEVRVYQYVDCEIRSKKEILEKPERARTKHEASEVREYELEAGIVYKRRDGKLLYVIPSVMRKSLVIRFHELKSHPGAERTTARIVAHYYFPRWEHT